MAGGLWVLGLKTRDVFFLRAGAHLVGFFSNLVINCFRHIDLAL